MNQRQEVFFPLHKFFYRHLIYSRCSGILSYLLPCRLQSSRFIDLHQHFSYFHFTFSVISLDTEDCRPVGASWPGPDSLFDPGAFTLGYRFTIRLSLLDFWSFPISVLFRLLCAITATFRPRLPLSR
jgi:hypothetical protein